MVQQKPASVSPAYHAQQAADYLRDAAPMIGRTQRETGRECIMAAAAHALLAMAGEVALLVDAVARRG